MITLTDENGNPVELQISDIKRFRGTDYPRKDCTWIELKDGSELWVLEDFDTVDLVYENEKKSTKN